MIATQNLANALFSLCGISSDNKTATTAIMSHTVGFEDETSGMVVPCEWSEDDLVEGDREYENSIEGTQVTDIASLYAETHIRG